MNDCRQGCAAHTDLEGLARCLVLRLAEELGPDEALRLAPSLVRALGGFLVDAQELRARREVVWACRRMSALDFVSGTSGNFSQRLDSRTLLMTPSGMHKGDVVEDDLVRMTVEGQVLGSGRPSTEYRMHLAIYQARPDVHAVAHAHPPFATGFAAAGLALDQPLLPETLMVLGPRVPLVPYGTPSTDELPRAMQPYLPDHQAFLLANHGAVTLGSTMAEAVHRMETLEFFARVLLYARLLGGEKLLTDEQLRRLAQARPYASSQEGRTGTPFSGKAFERGPAG
ncbi:MAG TPA: class II aldolase/adducin family protein [Candidatus Nitrosotenuis sp.]|nr:class II aldolase/adducin family protein [Candidatus Nitrosotenuis sp.]